LTAATATLSKLLAWRPGGYLRASGVLFGWLAVRTAAQTVLFVLVARTLGAEGYGALISVMAVATLFAPLAGLGARPLMVREGARDPGRLSGHVGDALKLWALSVVPLCVLAFTICRFLVPSALPASAMAAIVLAEIAGTSLIDTLARTWHAAQRMGEFGMVMAGLIIARLAVFCVLLGIAPPDPIEWALWYGVITGVYALGAAATMARTFGRPSSSRTRLASLAYAGFPFAFAGTAMRIQAEASKPILARLDTVAGAGVFGAAQRVTDLILLPLQALIDTLMPRAYRATSPDMRIIFVLGIPSLVVATGSGFLIIVGARWLPMILGASYVEAVGIARLLAFLPVLLVFRTLLATLLAAHNGQHHFYLIYGPGVTAGIGVTLLLVPRLGEVGAVVGAYVSEAMIILLQGAVLFWLRRGNTRKVI
jgi:O-antigen/teichoic acid export membrane protein